MTDAEPLVVTQPGIYPGLSDADYHRDAVPGGSLSSTGARKLLPPSCPALYRHWADNPQPPRAHFDFGHAAHREVLGAGAEVAVIDAPDWKTKAARDERDAARAAGLVPLLPPEYERVKAMAAALREHPIASVLFNHAHGEPEQSLFWIDEPTGVWCRARVDFMPHPGRGRRLVVPDYKSTDSVAPDDIARSVYRYGYHIQDAFYSRGIRALGLADDVAFVFVFQAKEPPYLVTVAEVDPTAKAIAGRLVDDALRTYAECTAAGHWPGFSDDVELISLPRWAERQYEQEF